MRVSVIFLISLLSSFAVAEIESVTVFDGHFQQLNEISQEIDLSKFKSVWQTKTAATVKIKINWSEGYKIDISGGKDSGRWLYRGGWLMPLSKSPSGLYQIKNHQELESVLGITHNKSKHSDLGNLSPFFAKYAKNPPSHPSRCLRRYELSYEADF